MEQQHSTCISFGTTDYDFINEDFVKNIKGKVNQLVVGGAWKTNTIITKPGR